MSQTILPILAITTVLLVVINILPTNRGVMLSCYPSMEHAYRPQETHGFPMTYIKANRTGSACFAIDQTSGGDIKQGSNKQYDKYFFQPVGFIVDAVVAFGVLGTQAWLVRRLSGGKA